jgi:hypothetical protein
METLNADEVRRVPQGRTTVTDAEIAEFSSPSL